MNKENNYIWPKPEDAIAPTWSDEDKSIAALLDDGTTIVGKLVIEDYFYDEDGFDHPMWYIENNNLKIPLYEAETYIITD